MGMREKIEIFPMSKDHIKDVNAANDSFPIFGKIVPSFQDGKWSIEELLFKETHEIRFPDDQLDWENYINSKDKVILLAFLDQQCIGQIRIIKDFTRFGYIENIAVKKNFRKLGLGQRLLAEAEDWAKQNQLIGLSLETQDDNLGACRFYIKHGFKLGGVDVYRHLFNDNIDKALFWYKPF